MWCTRCNHDLADCTCPDLQDRLAKLGQSPNLGLTFCSGCGQYYSRCKCPDKPALETRSAGKIIATPERPAPGPEVRMENWSLYLGGDAYTAPEARRLRLHGNAYGHPRFADGTHIHTSDIMHADDTYIVTRSGTRYLLGAVDPEYERLYPGARERCFAEFKKAQT